jgi:hypothetical protein
MNIGRAHSFVPHRNMRADPAIGGQHNSAIPHSLRRLDSFGEIDFAVHLVTPSLKTVSSEVSRACKC